jgi:hypothetical protein
MAFYIVITACLILCVGHVGWGIIHPFKAAKDSNTPPVFLASLHACWYHISILFFVTAALLSWHLLVDAVSVDVMMLLWVLIFGSWLSYLATLLFFPQLWRIAWFQMVLIVVLLASLASGIYEVHGAA